MNKLPNNLKASGVKFDLLPNALTKWSAGVRAASNDDNGISILDPIGEDYWGDGVSSKRIAGALRSIGEGDVVVNINSPGGDMFEGLAIYSMLKEHPGKVTVKVLGLAASAASIIAMAGDEVQIARAGFLMIHNAWIGVAGNRHDLRDYAEYLEPFDASMADIYQARTNQDAKLITKMMDSETFIGGNDSVDQGFADSLLSSDAITEEENAQAMAASKLDVALAKAGLPRSERRKLLKEYKSTTQNASGGGTPSATVTNKPSAVANLEPLHRISFPK